MTAYSGGPGSAAFSPPDTSQPGTTDQTYDGLGRLLSVQNAVSQVTTTSYSVGCGDILHDSDCYELTATIDPLGHKTTSFTDALGRSDYSETFTGTSPSTYASYAITSALYTLTGQLKQLTRPDGLLVKFGYDLAGRETSLSDPDRGNASVVYDANDNPTKTVDARGAGGTIYAGYDGLNRQLWRNTTNSQTGAYVSYAYNNANGVLGAGQLASESFTNSNTASGRSLAGEYTYAYDDRGEVTGSTLTVDGTGYTTSATYDDAGQPLTQTYPNGDVVTTSYTGQGWLGAIDLTPYHLPGLPLLSAITYTGQLGATGTPSGGQLDGSILTYSASADALLRPTDTKYTQTSGGTTVYEVQPSYDAASNVIGVATTLASGTDTQTFCYDDLNRLVWASSANSIGPCGANTEGSLTSASYTQSFSYDTLDRLTSGPAGSYTYGDSSHPDAATSIGAAYTAAYDAVGDMVCRAPTASQTCAGTQTGASLSYDNEGRLGKWQNTPSSPPTTDSFLYDGAGNRIEQVVQQSGVGTTDTAYVGGLEEVTTTTPTGGQPTTSTTAYYSGLALSVNGALSFLVHDGLGTATEALDSGGHVTASRLYTPYGSSRYTSGTFPTEFGFTGYRADTITGLNYANARYYDPAAGQFTSADPTSGSGLNRYAYAGGSPETKTDPTGLIVTCGSCRQPSSYTDPQYQQYLIALAFSGAIEPATGMPYLLYFRLYEPQAYGIVAAYGAQHGIDVDAVSSFQAVVYRESRSPAYWAANQTEAAKVNMATLQAAEMSGGGDAHPTESWITMASSPATQGTWATSATRSARSWGWTRSAMGRGLTARRRCRGSRTSPPTLVVGRLIRRIPARPVVVAVASRLRPARWWRRRMVSKLSARWWSARRWWRIIPPRGRPAPRRCNTSSSTTTATCWT